MKMEYTYKKSCLKYLIEQFEDEFIDSDIYTTILRSPLWVLIAIIGFPIALIVDIAVSWWKTITN
jgi:hypothetical protein